MLGELSGRCLSTHLREGRISEFSPGSCFPNWLQGKPRMTRPNGCSSSCSAFSSGPGRESRDRGRPVRSPASSHQCLLASRTAEITEARQWGLAQDRSPNVSMLGVKSHSPDSAGWVAGLGGKQVTPFLKSVFSHWPTVKFLQDYFLEQELSPLGEGRGLPWGEVGPSEPSYTLGIRDPREALAQLPLPMAGTRPCPTLLLHKRTALFQGLTEAF